MAIDGAVVWVDVPGVNTTSFLTTKSRPVDGAVVAWDDAADRFKVTASGSAVLATQIYRYDFAVQGGAIGSIPLVGPLIPAHALIVVVIFDVITSLVGAGATIAVQIETLDDVVYTVDPTNFAVGNLEGSGLQWEQGNTFHTANAATSATVDDYLKTTQQVQPWLEVAGAPLTAGKFNLIVQYIVSE